MPTSLPITSFSGPAAGGTITITLTSESPTEATIVVSRPCRLYSITNSGPQMNVFPEFFNDPSGTVPADTLFYGDGSTVFLSIGQIIEWGQGLPLAGLSYELSGALTANLSLVVGPL
jgi:hypothetical protein